MQVTASIATPVTDDGHRACRSVAVVLTVMSPATPILFVLGLIGLIGGAELLVRGGVAIARRTGLSPVVIGLTVVSFGTSAPELAVSLGAATRGEGDLAVGNVIGSNIANILLVLGIAALVGGGLSVARRLTRIDIPIMIAASALFLVLSLNGQLGRVDGFILFGSLVVYLVWMIRNARRGDGSPVAEVLAAGVDTEISVPRSVMADIGLLVVGLAALTIGANLLVSAATDVATRFGISQLVIGLTVVAIGTSLPEIATSTIAAFRGQRELAVGNAIGSNIFNLLAVLGLTSIVSPLPLNVLDAAISIDIPIMIATAVATLPLFATGYALSRFEGAVFVTYYSAYLIWLILDASGAAIRDNFATAMVWFVAPLTALTIGVIAVRDWRRRSGRI